MFSTRWIQCLCWAMLVLVIAITPFAVQKMPATNEGYVQSFHNDWAGVIRIWLHDTWKPGNGSFIPWLNACAARFEKRFPGVYIQITPISTAAFGDLLSASSNPPDAVLFAPQSLSSGIGLTEQEAHPSLCSSLTDAGRYQDRLCAQPVAMGGYVWVINRALLDSVPIDWSALADLPPPQSGKKQPRHLMQVPADQPFTNWSAALNALCAPRVVTPESKQSHAASYEIDLGLPTAPTPSIDTTPAESEIILCRLPQSLPDDFRQSSSALSTFLTGNTAAIPATQYEIRQLQLRSDQGRAPDWIAEPGNAAFSDQLLMMGIVDHPRNDSTQRQQLAEKFMASLLDEDAQIALSGIRALRVTYGASLYRNQAGMDVLEQVFSESFTIPNAFDNTWRKRSAAEADRLTRET